MSVESQRNSWSAVVIALVVSVLGLVAIMYVGVVLACVSHSVDLLFLLGTIVVVGGEVVEGVVVSIVVDIGVVVLGVCGNRGCSWRGC